MKIFKTFILFHIMLNYTYCHSQDIKVNKEVEEIILLGKDSIVQLALTFFDGEIGIQNFTKITVMTNGKEVYVSFRNPIKYLPMNSVLYFDTEVNLLEKVIAYNAISNGIVESKNNVIPFYLETPEAKMNINFVIEAINKSNEVGSFDRANFEDDMIIREHENYYAISIVSEFQESFYRIEKITGKISDIQHAHLIPAPFERENEDLFKEIN